MTAFKERPHDHGWIKINGFLIPGKHPVPMPLYYTAQCGYKSSFPGFADVQNLKQYAQNFVVAKEMPDQVAVMRPAYNENTYSDTYSYVSNI